MNITHSAFFAPFLGFTMFLGMSCGVLVLQSDFDGYKARQDYRQAQLTEFSIQFARGLITVEEYQTYCEQINQIIKTTNQ